MPDAVSPTPSPVSLVEVFTQAIAKRASDVHVTAGAAPLVRISGDLYALQGMPPIPAAALLEQLRALAIPDRWQAFLNRTEDLDLSFTLPNKERFRLSAYWTQNIPAVAARHIPGRIPTLDEVEAPEAALDFIGLTQGLVLVTGPTGAGKSTLLAAMVGQINQQRSCHIVTFEDPVEFVHTPQRCLISQRELGVDFATFASGLRHVLRQDPDVILVGEMRDRETMVAALTLAETGHLVFSTLHTNSAAQTVERIVDSFPPEQQPQIRVQLSLILKGVISQLLVQGIDGLLRPVHEVMVGTPAVANLIRESQTAQIPNIILTSSSDKMVDLDQELALLLDEGAISLETARQYARNPKRFPQK